MFSLTANATSALIAARSEFGAPDEWGIRFYEPVEGQPAITFDFVATPEPDDVLGGSSKLRTYVDSAVHQRLGNATVDFRDSDGTSEMVITPHR